MLKEPYQPFKALGVNNFGTINYQYNLFFLLPVITVYVWIKSWVLQEKGYLSS